MTTTPCYSAIAMATKRPSPIWCCVTSVRCTTRRSGSCASPADANDVTQTVFLKVAHQAGDYDPQHKFFSWIYRITVNESLNVLRRRRHEETLDDDDDRPADGDHDPEVRVGAAEVARRIRSVLMRMSTNDRMVLSLRHFSELGYAQIASALDIDIKTVKSRLHEARQRLAAQLQDLRTH